jgi:hypothetical protein
VLRQQRSRTPLWLRAGSGPADRLDPERLAVRVDERDYLLDWRSSSAPKKADAASELEDAGILAPMWRARWTAQQVSQALETHALNEAA